MDIFLKRLLLKIGMIGLITGQLTLIMSQKKSLLKFKMTKVALKNNGLEIMFLKTNGNHSEARKVWKN